MKRTFTITFTCSLMTILHTNINTKIDCENWYYELHKADYFRPARPTDLSSYYYRHLHLLTPHLLPGLVSHNDNFYDYR